MPVADKKVPKKSKKGAEKAPRPPPLGNITVRDCMVWPEPAAKGPGKRANKGTAPDPKPSVYHSTLVRREKTEGQLDDEEGRSNAPPPPLVKTRRDDGTVIEALRGWPGSRVQMEDDVRHFEVTEEAPVGKTSDPKTGKNSKKKNGKKEKEANVFIGDLIHQRYLNEHLEKRRKEMEREQNKKSFGGRTGLRGNIKGNRTSQLRSIALAEKVESSPLDLWKMPRFTRDAQPRLATVNGGGAALQGRAGADRSDQYNATNGVVCGEDCDGSGGRCHCTTNYVDENEDEIQYGDGHENLVAAI